MKAQILFMTFSLLLSTIGHCQINDQKSFFSNLKISSNVSSISPGGRHFRKNESLLPYGVGLEISVISIKRFSVSLEFEYRTSGNRNFVGYMTSDPFGYSGSFLEKDLRQFFDISAYLNYEIFSKGFFNLKLVAGTKKTFEKSRFLTQTDEERIDYYNSQNVGIDLGIVETFKISNKIYLFAGQFRDQYLGIPELRTIDLKFGCEIKLK